MNENQLEIMEEEEEENISQFNNTSDVFSLLNNIKQPQLIDVEAASQNELSPDAYALSEVIKQLLPLLNGSCELYSDLRQRFVEQKLRQFHFSIHSEVIADVQPNSSGIRLGNMDELKAGLIKIAHQLRQFKVQNANTQMQHDQTIKQLQSENESLRNDLSSLRQAQFVGSSSFSSPERASSSQVTFQSMVITPKTIRTDQTSTSSSTLSPSPSNKSPSPSFIPRANNYSSASPRTNNSPSISSRANNSSSASPRANNSFSVSPRANNSSSMSPRANNYSSASPRPNPSSPVSSRSNNSASVSPKSNHSSSSSNLK